MRASLILGLVLIAAGIFMILRPIHYPSDHTAVKIGSFEAKVETDRTLPPWAGGIVLGAGVVLLGAGLIKR
jgi:hypothetical protein